MNLEFDNDVTINGKDYWVKAQVSVDFTEKSYLENFWGGFIEMKEPYIDRTVEELVILDYSEEDQEYNIQVVDDDIRYEARKIVEEWAEDQEIEV